MEIFNGFEPHPKQQQWLDMKVKFKALITGVGFGKTAAGANQILITAMNYPKSLHLILAPTSKIMQNATLPQFFKFCPREIISSHIKSRNLIILKNNARIIYLTADNERHVDRLRGMEIGSCWPDEVRLLPKYVWEVLLTRLRDPNGPLEIYPTTTPAGFDWLYWYFVKKVHPDTKKPLANAKDYAYVTGSTLDNPYTPQEFKDTLMAQFSGKFRDQEIFGSFTSFEGQVYDNFRPDIHIIEPPTTEFKEYVVGIDPGFTNPTAVLLVGFDSDDRAYVLEEFYQRRMPEETVSQWIADVCKKHKCSPVVFSDPANPAFIYKMANLGNDIQAADNDVQAGINMMYTRFSVAGDGKPRLYISRNCQNLIDEINQYRYADRKDNKEIKEKPLKVDDHAVDCCRYAIRSHDLGLGKIQIFTESPFF